MKKTVSYLFLLISLCCFGLCGCAEYPGMTEADYDLVAEYAAGVLLAHSEADESRLMDVEEAIRILEEEKTDEEMIPEEPVEEPEDEPVVEEPSQSDVTIIDNTEQVEEMPTAPINEAMGIDILTVQFNGYDISKSYPDGSGAFFALDSGDGNKLLVTKLILMNNTDTSVDVNMLEKNVSFKVSLDGNGYKFVLSTMLLDDLSTYVGTLNSGDSVELVLLSEWKEEELVNISNPTLYIKNGELSGSYPIQ